MKNESHQIAESYLMAERDFVRAIASEYSKETAALEKYALTLSGVIWSWGATHFGSVGIKVLFFAPALTTFLFGLRAWSVYRARESARAYVRTLSPSGWESYLCDHSGSFRVHTAYMFWVALQLVTLSVGIYYWFKLP